MFKVDCPGCNAPYQVDERRVPQTGLKMRCPKCGTSFQVNKPGAEAGAPKQQPARPSPGLRGTMIGVASQRGGATPPPAPARPAAKNKAAARTIMGVAAPGGSAPPQAGAPGAGPQKPPPQRRKPSLKGTMIGVAPAGGSSPVGPPTRSAGDAQTPGSPPRRKPPLPGRAGAAGPGGSPAGAGNQDLPAPRAGAGVPGARAAEDLPAPRAQSKSNALPAPNAGVDLPARVGAAPSRPGSKLSASDLPARSATGQNVSLSLKPGQAAPNRPVSLEPGALRSEMPEAGDDLPAIAQPKAPKGIALSPSLGAQSRESKQSPQHKQAPKGDDSTDLPAVLGRTGPAATQSGSKPTIPKPDLPAGAAIATELAAALSEQPAPPKGASRELDLGDLDLPASLGDLPAPTGSASDEFALDDLPASLRQPFAPPVPTPASQPDEVDLPAARDELTRGPAGTPMVSDIPAALVGAPSAPMHADLPEPADRFAGGLDLGPSLSAELDQQSSDAQQSASKATSSEDNPFALGPDVGTIADLPDPAINDPDAGFDLGLGGDSLELPSPAADFDGDRDSLEMDSSFGHLDLPLVSASEPEESPEPSPAAAAAAALGSFDTPGSGSDLPEMPDLDAAFGPPPTPAATSTPGSGEFGTSESMSEFGAIGDLDTHSPSGPGVANRSSGFGDGMSLDDDEFGENADDLLASEPPPGQQTSATRQAGGGTEYGQVNFGDSGGGGLDDFDDFDTSSGGSPGLETGDGMEFGGIPQEEDSLDSDAPIGMDPTTELDQPPAGPAPAQPGPRPQPAAEKPKKKGKLKWVFASFLLLAVAGGALALVPAIGPFGAHYALDILNADKHAALLEQTAKTAQDKRASDDLAAARQAILLTERARGSAERYKPLQAYTAFQKYSMVLRFGSMPSDQSSAKVIMDVLKEHGVSSEVARFPLAQAAELAVQGELDKARDKLTRLKSRRAKDLDVLTTLGELELSAGQYEAAAQVWAEAVAARPSAWTHYGLARSQFGLKDAKAKASAEAAVQANPKHAGAKLLLAELFWTDANEDQATKLIDEVIKQGAEASQADRVLAHTLLAEIHLKRGRVSKAESEFTLALKVEPKATRPLLGLADTFFSGGRYSAALSRYETAAASTPESVPAQVGIAKTQISLEKMNEAKQQLTKLAKAHPKHAEVSFWFAKVAEHAGNRELAQQSYENAIANGGTSDVALESYVALAQLFAQIGKHDEASARLKEAQKKVPGSATLHKALGEVALSQGRYEEALAAFTKAQSLDPKDIGATFKVGSCLRRLRRFDEALKVFDDVAKVDKDLPGLPLERGLLLEQSGHSDQALAEYESALKKSPDDLDLKLRVGCGRVVAGNGVEAEAILREVQKKRPDSAENNHCIGRALFLQSKNLEALRFLQQSVTRDPNRAEYHLHLGWVANEAGQVALAQQALDRAIELDQGLADAYWQRGILLLSRGNASEAIVNLKQALELKPSRYEAHAELAQAYYQIGSEVKAMNEWRLALAQDKDQPTWLFRFGKLLHARHHAGEAATHLTRAIALAEKLDPPPSWLWQAHQLAASSLGPGQRALKHWRKFLELGPEDSPYREDAKRALLRAGQAWTGN